MALEIDLFPVLQDNYVHFLRDTNSGKTAVVDPSVAGAVLDELERRKWKLDYILNTHHHWDHSDGNLEIQRTHGCQIVGAQKDRARIPGLQMGLVENEVFRLGQTTARIIETPGHTVGHIAFYFDSGDVFSGDTLFSLGCGRLFEGSPEQMWSSLQKLSALDGPTRLWCGHEYTAASARFALEIEPENIFLQTRAQQVKALRAAGQATLPTTIELENKTNPFLRPHSPDIRQRFSLESATDTQVFARLRNLKNDWKG